MDFKIFLSAHRDWFRTLWPYRAEANVRRAALFCCTSHRIAVENGRQLQMINFTWPTLRPICMCWNRKGFFMTRCVHRCWGCSARGLSCTFCWEWILDHIDQTEGLTADSSTISITFIYMSASVSLNVEAEEAGATDCSVWSCSLGEAATFQFQSNSFNEVLSGTGQVYAVIKSQNQLLSRILTGMNAGHRFSWNIPKFGQKHSLGTLKKSPPAELYSYRASKHQRGFCHSSSSAGVIWEQPHTGPSIMPE